MPSPLLQVVRGLNFADPHPRDLRAIPESEWPSLLELTDRSQLTLPLGVHCREHLPEPVGRRIDGNLASNAIRSARIFETYRRVSEALTEQRIEYVVLKGFSHFPLYCPDLRHRPQYDLDFYCPPSQIQAAYAVLIKLGYEPFGRTGRTVMDHLPPLILKTGWRATGDYYDADIPITIELHFRFWDAATERFDVSGGDRFWERRRPTQCGSLVYPALHPADGFSYAAWHLVRHLLRGDVRAYHVYELAHFLEQTAADDDFWRDWRDLRPSPLAETIACRLASEWFGCRSHPVMRELLDAMPAQIQTWFRVFGWSPLLALEKPNKDELFLHLSLVDSLEDRIRIAKRRLFPRRANPYIADVHVAAPDLRLRLKRRIVAAAVIGSRVLHHARALAPLVRNGIRWRRSLAGLPRTRVGRKLRAETARP